MQQPRNPNRIERVNSLIQQLLGTILLDFFKNGPAIVTISKVECSRDLKWAKVWVTITNAKNDQSIMTHLQKHLYDIQGEINRTLQMKIIPRISFYLDTTARHAARINELFQQIEEEKNDEQSK
jgi:ribosome-binding factor A